MKKPLVIKKISDCGLIPIIRADSADQVLRIVDALVAGNVLDLEITMTVPGALAIIETVVKKVGDTVAIGAGSILDPETARLAINAGADFIVCPGTNDATIALCRRHSILICPGALTPTEVIHAWEAGADFVKIFPCGEVGGAKYIRSLKGPLPHIEMVPTGGVDLTTAADFIKAGCAALGVGTSLIDKKAVTSGNYAFITENAKKYLDVVKQAREQK